MGYWEGDTLVVVTTNFRKDGTGLGRGADRVRIRADYGGDPTHAPRVTERFTRVDADTLKVQFTVEDPARIRPYSGELWINRTDTTSCTSTPATRGTTRLKAYSRARAPRTPKAGSEAVGANGGGSTSVRHPCNGGEIRHHRCGCSRHSSCSPRSISSQGERHEHETES